MRRFNLCIKGRRIGAPMLEGHVCSVINDKVQGLPRWTHFSMGRRKLVRW